MRERTFKIDKDKSAVLRATRGVQADIARQMNTQRQHIHQYLLGTKDIPESKFKQLLAITGKESAELLTDESQKFLLGLSL